MTDAFDSLNVFDDHTVRSVRKDSSCYPQNNRKSSSCSKLLEQRIRTEKVLPCRSHFNGTNGRVISNDVCTVGGASSACSSTGDLNHQWTTFMRPVKYVEDKEFNMNRKIMSPLPPHEVANKLTATLLQDFTSNIICDIGQYFIRGTSFLEDSLPPVVFKIRIFEGDVGSIVGVFPRGADFDRIRFSSWGQSLFQHLKERLTCSSDDFKHNMQPPVLSREQYAPPEQTSDIINIEFLVEMANGSVIEMEDTLTMVQLLLEDCDNFMILSQVWYVLLPLLESGEVSFTYPAIMALHKISAKSILDKNGYSLATILLKEEIVGNLCRIFPSFSQMVQLQCAKLFHVIVRNNILSPKKVDYVWAKISGLLCMARDVVVEDVLNEVANFLWHLRVEVPCSNVYEKAATRSQNVAHPAICLAGGGRRSQFFTGG
eukprot:Filipodium_phascolosomae@DN1034_c0_g1_i1.p1